jgi:hypothetical protein
VVDVRLGATGPVHIVEDGPLRAAGRRAPPGQPARPRLPSHTPRHAEAVAPPSGEHAAPPRPRTLRPWLPSSPPSSAPIVYRPSRVR